MLSSFLLLPIILIINYSFFNYRIRYGSNNRKEVKFESELARIKLHPKFDLPTVQNDLALFILKDPITPSENVRMVSLQSTELMTETNMTLFGFGLINGMGNSPSERLQKTTLRTVNQTDCAAYIHDLGVTIHPGMLCASSPDRSACNVSTFVLSSIQ